jgi:dipeptidyl aminopeptidase/acylaminoacyl peptidase
MVQPFEARKLQLSGEPVPVAEHVGTTGSIGIFSASPTGVLAYRTGTAAAGSVQPTWFDRQGKVTGAFGQPGPDEGLVLSPDATRAAGRDATPRSRGDIWLLDFARGVRTRLTFRQSPGSFPVWSPDGNRIIFSAGSLLDTIYEKAASGAGEEKELFKTPNEAKLPSSWSRDGRFLLYTTLNLGKPGNDLWVLPLEGDRKPVLLLGTEFNEGQGTFRPTCAGSRTPPMSPVGVRSTSGRSLPRDLPHPLSAKVSGKYPRMAELGPSGAVMARRSSLRVPPTR